MRNGKVLVYLSWGTVEKAVLSCIIMYYKMLSEEVRKPYVKKIRKYEN